MASIDRPDRRRKIDALCKEYGIEILYAFGSRAGEALEAIEGARESLSPSDSDLDIGVKSVRPLGIKEKSCLAVRDAFQEWIAHHEEFVDSSL